MKLNKNGWGYFEFFAFLIIFIICLIIAALGLKQFGLIDENWQFIKFEDIGKNEKEEKLKESYSNLRNTMVDGTMKYISKYYNNELGLDTLNIRVKQLVEEGYITSFKDANGDACSGYTAVYKDDNGRVLYNPYLKCKDFETGGYEERKDEKIE